MATGKALHRIDHSEEIKPGYVVTDGVEDVLH